ncbi:MAG: hypothetical protein R3D30_00660 [Hyphomicrobiales bacterium]
MSRTPGTGDVDISISAYGSVAGTTTYGINAQNSGAALTITTAAPPPSRASYEASSHNSGGTGLLTITANGNVTGTSGAGMHFQAGNGASITTAAVYGGSNGIVGTNATGAMTVTANGAVTGNTGIGLTPQQWHQSLRDRSAAEPSRATATVGIAAVNAGSGFLTVETNGDVTGTGASAILATNSGTYLSVTTAAGTTGNQRRWRPWYRNHQQRQRRDDDQRLWRSHRCLERHLRREPVRDEQRSLHHLRAHTPSAAPISASMPATPELALLISPPTAPSPAPAVTASKRTTPPLVPTCPLPRPPLSWATPDGIYAHNRGRWLAERRG